MGLCSRVPFRESIYLNSLCTFKTVCTKFPKFLKYVQYTILDRVKKKIARAWIYRVMHVRDTTTNMNTDNIIIYLFYYYNLLNKLVFSFIFVGVFYYFMFNFQ